MEEAHLVLVNAAQPCPAVAVGGDNLELGIVLKRAFGLIHALLIGSGEYQASAFLGLVPAVECSHEVELAWKCRLIALDNGEVVVVTRNAEANHCLACCNALGEWLYSDAHIHLAAKLAAFVIFILGGEGNPAGYVLSVGEGDVPLLGGLG